MKSVALRYASILAFAVACAPALAATPGYMKADRAGVERKFGKFGAMIAGNIFSDRLTSTRKKFVADTLRKNPAPGCERAPSFTIVAVAPLFANEKDGTAWEERFDIACAPAVFRTALFNASPAHGMQMSESVPGQTLADVALRNQFLPKLREAAAGPGCEAKKIGVLDAAPVSKPEKDGAPWTEVWKLKACGAVKEIEVALTPGEGGGATTWQFTTKAITGLPGDQQPDPPAKTDEPPVKVEEPPPQ